MDIGIVGGGINGLCCAWQLARQGHRVHVYERDTLMQATSRASSKLLHGGLRYLENGELRLVREALHERDGWLQRMPDLAKPLRLILPIYRQARRPRWMIALGLWAYDRLAGHSTLPQSERLSTQTVLACNPYLNPQGLQGGYAFSDGQMDDQALGLWIAAQAQAQGVQISEHTDIATVHTTGHITTASGTTHQHERVLNVAGPWAQQLLQRSALSSPYRLDLVRGSHLILAQACPQAFLLEVPGERRIFFVLPWQGNTLIGTTEIRQTLHEPITCSRHEQHYLLQAWQHYFPHAQANVIDTFSGLRPLLYSAGDPNKATREYAIHRDGQLISVLGGKWTTALALARKVTQTIN
ncbi:MAG: FAD-dependent oxidoreductase [Pseudomonadota bacterium]